MRSLTRKSRFTLLVILGRQLEILHVLVCFALVTPENYSQQGYGKQYKEIIVTVFNSLLFHNLILTF